MNRRPTRAETSYYGIIPRDAELQWQVRLHRDDREHQRDIKHRQFVWPDPDGSMHETELTLWDNEIRSFGGSPLPAPVQNMTPELWELYLHRRHPDHELDAYRRDGWTVDVWLPNPPTPTLF